jgi:hypothetical protein
MRQGRVQEVKILNYATLLVSAREAVFSYI